MISTPETGVDSIAVTYALLDPFMTVIRPVAAFFTALFSGLLVNAFDREKNEKPEIAKAEPTVLPGHILPMADISGGNSGCGCSLGGTNGEELLAKKTAVDRLRKGMSFAFGTLLSDIGSWLLLGIGLAAVITVAVSPQFIESYLGDGIFSMLIMIALATPLYVCATASTPIAAALALKGLSPGAALVFLLAGPATNVATITIVAKMLGRKTAVIYVSSIMICSVVLGLVVNWFYIQLGLDIAGWIHGENHEGHGLLYIISALLLLFLIVKPWCVQLYNKVCHSPDSTPDKHQHHSCGCGH